MTTAGGRTEADSAALRLGAHIRRLRRSRGDTLVRLAERTDLSHPFLSQLERGLAQPSLSSLRRIAVALGTSPIELVAAAEDLTPSVAPPRVELRRACDPAPGVAGFAEGTARLLAHSDRPFHPLEYVSDNRTPGDYYEHAEDEFLYVIAGPVVIDLDGAVDTLNAGDAIYYAGRVRHRWWSVTGEYRLVIVKQRPDLGRAFASG